MHPDGIFILTAGLGTRLRPLTHFRPKPCVPVLGRTPLERWAAAIEPLVPKKIVLNTHHLRDQIEWHWEKIASKTWRYCFSYEPQILDTGGGLREALKRIRGTGPVLVLNGDVLANAPFAGLFEAHAKSGALCTAWVSRAHEPRTVAWGPDEVITAFRDRERGGAVFCGVYLVERRILNFIPDEGPFPVIDALEAALKTGECVRAFPTSDAAWCDIGSLEAYWKIHCEPGPRRTWGGDEAADGLLARGSNCRIAPEARLNNALLWDNVQIEPGARLENVIAVDDARVSGEHNNRIITPCGTHPLLG